MIMSGRNNRANQCNPNHPKTGPGRSAGYYGDGTQSDRNNHANQLNPNNERYRSRGGNQLPGNYNNQQSEMAEEEEEGSTFLEKVETAAMFGVGLVALYTIFRSVQAANQD